MQRSEGRNTARENGHPCFTNAVKVGSKIRARCTLLAAEEVKSSLQLTEKYTVEIEGEDRPACVAECIMRLYF